MKRIFTLTIFCFFCTLSTKAILKTWVGASGGGWNTAGNWSPSGVPTFNDTALFNTSVTALVDINPSLAALQVKSNAAVILSSAASRLITIGNGGTPVEALLIQSGCSLTLGSGSAVSIQTYGNLVTNTANIYGTLVLGQGTSAWAVGSGSFSNCISTVYGAVQLAATNSGSIITGSTTTNLRFLSGSSLLWQRNGGVMPTGDFQNGSTINYTGVTSTVPSLTSSCIYAGLIIWNCTGQTATPSGGSGANLISANVTLDSLRIVSTGASGILRGNTDLQGVTIGNLEIDGGTFEIAAPRSADRTLTINNNLEVSGGTLFISATDATDGGVKESVTVTVNGNVLVSSGTLNMCNRTNGTFSTYSTGNIICNGAAFTQSGGLITETGDIPPISDASYISMAGTSPQSLSLTNWNNEIRLTVSNTSGVTLQSNVTCPEFLLMTTPGAYIALGNYHLTTAYNRYTITSSGTNPARLLTNGTGHFTLTGVPSASTVTFPVTPTVTSISSVILKNNDITANDFNVRVERGNNPGGVFNTGLTVNRTWIVNDASNINANQVELTFLYPDTALNILCNRSGPMELGHFAGGSWSVDPVATLRTPSQGGASPAIDTTGTFAPNSLDSAFVLGNQFSILNIATGISMNYFRGNKQGTANALNWAVNCTSNEAKFEIQRSSNGTVFTGIGNINASYIRCLEPFAFTDANPLAGLNYYRIKITDIDGTVTYSTQVLLQNKGCAPGGMSLTPSLVTQSYATVCIDAASAAPAQFSIISSNGSRVQTVTEALAAGQNQFTLNLGSLPPGVYYITAASARQHWPAIRFVKQ